MILHAPSLRRPRNPLKHKNKQGFPMHLFFGANLSSPCICLASRGERGDHSFINTSLCVCLALMPISPQRRRRGMFIANRGKKPLAPWRRHVFPITKKQDMPLLWSLASSDSISINMLTYGACGFKPLDCLRALALLTRWTLNTHLVSARHLQRGKAANRFSGFSGAEKPLKRLRTLR